MITMDVKGINWVGNMYQKFENMCLEAEDIMYEDTVKYMEDQMKAVGATFKKLYSDIMGDLLPPLSCDLDEVEKEDSELPIDQYTDAGFNKKPFQIFKERPVKAKLTEDSRIDNNIDNDCIHATSYDRTCETDALLIASSRNSVKGSNFIPHSRCMDIKSNLAIDQNQVNKKMAATKIFNEITTAETDTCRTTKCCEISNVDQNQYHGISVSKTASAEVTRLGSEADHCSEIENASTEQFPDALVLVKSAEEKQIDTNSSCGPFGEPVGFSMDRTIQSDDCSNSMVVISHPGHKTMPEDHLKLEETCVMVSGDELLLVPKGAGNLKTTKKTRRQGFCLSKKSARKQEYEELAVLHGNSEKVNGDLLENINSTLLEDQKKLLLSSVSEPEWELV